MTIGDAHWVFEWTNLGDWVFVREPSGKNPADPNLFVPVGL
jgi:hypothetical protein